MTPETIHTLVGKSLKGRAAMANALCAVAEEELHAGQSARAVDTMRKVRGVLADIKLLLSGDTSYLPYGALRETSELLAGVDERIKAMEDATQTYTIH